jgi:hypothetical protein
VKRTRVILATTVVWVVAGATFGPDDGHIPDRVSESRLRRHVTVLAGDALQGRFPGTRGADVAATYLAETLEEWGWEPAGDRGGFLQWVPLHGSIPVEDTTFELRTLGDRHALDLGSDYVLYSTGPQTYVPEGTPLVFVGWGIVAPEFDHNDYAGLDVRGHVVVVLDGEPPSEDPEFFAGPASTVYSAPETKARIAMSRGARGTLVLPTDPRPPWDQVRRAFTFEHLHLAYDIPRHLHARLHPGIAELLFRDALHDLEDVRSLAVSGRLRGFHLPVTIAFDGRFRSRDVLSANVVGVLTGSDPDLRDEVVVVSAHYDHLGVGPAVGGDGVYNGLVDNALGVAGALELARVLASSSPRPRRSVMMALTTAEEEGLLGARYFLDHPSVPTTRMVANVNIDGLAIHDLFDDVIAIGGDLSDLGRILEAAVRPLGLEVGRPPVAVWSSEAYGRSDQLAFAEAGVPAVLVNEGFQWRSLTPQEAVERTLDWFAIRYHTPLDDLDQPVRWDAARLHAQALVAFVRELGDRRGVPEWRPDTPYAYVRALARAQQR